MAASRRLILATVAISVCLFGLSTSTCGVSDSDAAPLVDRLEGMFEAERLYAYEGLKEVVSPVGESLVSKWYVVTRRPGGPLKMAPMGEPEGRGRTRRIWGSLLHWFKDTRLLLENYEIREAGRAQLAGREGFVLEIVPRHPKRPSLRLVADEETGLLLSLERRNYLGELVFSSRFVTLLLTRVEREGERRRGPRRWTGPRAPAARPRPFEPLVARRLPAGFVEKRAWRFGGLHRTLYSDGLVWIELSQWRARPDAEEQVVRRTQAGDRTTLKMTYRGIGLKLVGSLDPDELLEVLRYVAPAERTETTDSG
jgi:hypothetical protein